MKCGFCYAETGVFIVDPDGTAWHNLCRARRNEHDVLVARLHLGAALQRRTMSHVEMMSHAFTEPDSQGATIARLTSAGMQISQTERGWRATDPVGTSYTFHSDDMLMLLQYAEAGSLRLDRIREALLGWLTHCTDQEGWRWLQAGALQCGERRFRSFSEATRSWSKS